MIQSRENGDLIIHKGWLIVDGSFQSGFHDKLGIQSKGASNPSSKPATSSKMLVASPSQSHSISIDAAPDRKLVDKKHT